MAGMAASRRAGLAELGRLALALLVGLCLALSGLSAQADARVEAALSSSAWAAAPATPPGDTWAAKALVCWGHGQAHATALVEMAAAEHLPAEDVTRMTWTAAPTAAPEPSAPDPLDRPPRN